MRKNYLVFMVYMLVTILGYSQTYADAKVMAVINLGTQSYSVLNELGTSRYYKTSLHPAGDLILYQEIELKFENSTIEVLSQTLQDRLYCFLIDQEEEEHYWIELLESMPSQEHDILFFEDTAHLHNFYESIDYFTRQDTNQEIDEILDLLEAQFEGFVSFRTWFNERYNVLSGEFTVQEVEEIYSSDFINDIIIKTILNENREVGIGDSIYYFHGLNKTLAIDKDNSSALQVLRDIDDDEEVIVPTYTESKDITIHSLGYNQSKDQVEVGALTKYVSSRQALPLPCNVYKKEFYVNILKYTRTSTTSSWVSQGNLNGDLSIDWGDGTSSTHINHYGSSSQKLYHTYANTGNYLISSVFTFIDGGNTIILEDTISITVLGACTNANNEMAGPTQISGDWMMISKLWINNNFFGNHIGALTHSYKKNSNGSWSLSKAQIKVTVSGIFRDSNCGGNETKNGSKENNNDKKIQEVKTKLFGKYYISNGDIQSTHRLIKGSTTLYTEIILNPC